MLNSAEQKQLSEAVEKATAAACADLTCGNLACEFGRALIIAHTALKAAEQRPKPLLEALKAVRPSCRAEGCWCQTSQGFHIDGTVIPHAAECLAARAAIRVYEGETK